MSHADASIRKSGLEIRNRCTEVPEMCPMAAAIANSGPEIENHCSAIVPSSRIARLRSRCRNGAASDSNFLRRKVSVSAITCPRYKKAGCVPCYSLVHLSGRRFRYASGLDPGGMAAVLLSTSDR